MSDDPANQPTVKVEMNGTYTGVDRPDPTPGTILGGRYELAARIGRGGMGDVLSARDLQLARDVAIKRVRHTKPSGKLIERFLREAMVQGRLEHPAIVPVHEIGTDDDGLPYFVMKRLSGTPLRQVMREPAALPRVLRAFADVCLAIEFAHVRGIVHRDLKPENIMLGDYGEVYVLDWGVAKVIGEEDGQFADVDSGENATVAGIALGTPGYMSPEQARGESEVDGRADVYILGCLLFEILAGEPLHPSGRLGMQTAIEGIDARPSRRRIDRDIPPELDELCVRATALDREKRLQTARELAEEIERYLDGDRDLARRRDLAREHLDRGVVAFAAGANERAVAMREAAAALALDPALEGAAELVGRLMLEPPRETPREVVQAMAADDIRDANAMGRLGIWVVVGALLFVPLLWWIAPPDTIYVPALLGLLIVDGIVARLGVRERRPWPEHAVIANTIIMLVLARMFSPLLVAPGIAASLAMAMVLTPRFSWLGSPITIGVLMTLALVVPLVLEQMGVISQTMAVTPEGVVFRVPGISGMKERVTVVVGAIYIVALVLGAVIAGHQLRSRTLAAQRHLHLQAWQLRHLVPG